MGKVGEPIPVHDNHGVLSGRVGNLTLEPSPLHTGQGVGQAVQINPGVPVEVPRIGGTVLGRDTLFPVGKFVQELKIEAGEILSGRCDVPRVWKDPILTQPLLEYATHTIGFDNINLLFGILTIGGDIAENLWVQAERKRLATEFAMVHVTAKRWEQLEWGCPVVDHGSDFDDLTSVVVESGGLNVDGYIGFHTATFE
jgi:hypothetical protein